MNALRRQDLFSLEDYSRQRSGFRSKVLAAKKHRAVRLGEHLLLLFENRLTIQYQVQEMLRIEKIFEADGIEEELEAYNPLVPDGDNFKATLMIQYTDVKVRRKKLTELVNIENLIWTRAGDGEEIYAIADEDLARSDETRTSAVHFLRFQLSADYISAVKGGAPIAFGVNHSLYTFAVDPVDAAVRTSLAGDLA